MSSSTSTSKSSSSSSSSSGSGASSSSGPAHDGGVVTSPDGGVGQVFPECRFHYGTIDSFAQQGGATLAAQLDMFTSGWIGSGTGLTQSVCKETNTGGILYGKVPALVSYIIAFTGRSAPGYCTADCNANNAGCTPASDLCTKGAAWIRAGFTSTILPEYKQYAQGFATSCGTARPMIWEMEPDYYQYVDTAQGGDPLTGAEAANYMLQMTQAVKAILPNAAFSMDISPWEPNNGCAWYAFFDMTQFTFVSTSGGGTLANSANIRAGENTWAGVHQCSGKPILADTGYGAAGGSAGPDPAWDVAANINARIANGVISITQYNPNATTWAATIAATRPSLNPVACY